MVNVKTSCSKKTVHKQTLAKAQDTCGNAPRFSVWLKATPSNLTSSSASENPAQANELRRIRCWSREGLSIRHGQAAFEALPDLHNTGNFIAIEVQDSPCQEGLPELTRTKVYDVYFIVFVQ